MKLIYTTFPNKISAKKICKVFLEENLCSCVNIFPVESMYRWKNKVEISKEVGALLKTLRPRRLMKRIKELHPYEIPVIIEIRPERVNKEYLEWMKW